MKKILLATTMLAGFAGAASADVTLSGSGRFGLVHQSDTVKPTSSTNVHDRLRFNIDANTVTDGGVTFGGRIRIQSDQGNGLVGSGTSPALLYASSNGMRLEVGNANTAYDSAALYYNSEVGFEDNSAGESGYNYYSFQSKTLPTANYMGIFFSYAAGPLNLRASFVNPDQTTTTLPAGIAKEMGVSADYTFGKFTVSAAYVKNGAGLKKNDQTFFGAAYALNSNTNVGVNYYSMGNSLLVAGAANATAGGNGNTITLYGNMKFGGAITGKAYVSNNNTKGIKKATVIGVGADYDLGGGAALSGSYRQNFNGSNSADVGVKFSF